MSFLCFGQQAISPTMDDDNEEDAYTTPDEYFTSSDDDDDEGEQEEEKEAAEADSKPKKSFSSTKSSSYAVDATKHQQLLRVPRLTEPLKLDRKSSAGGKHQDAAAAAAKPKAAKTGGNGSLVASVVEVFKGFRPGSDLTKFQVPPQFNLPKSQLQVYGEAVYCCSQDLLGSCADGATAIDRFLAVVRWHLSTTRPAPFAKAPYNPILGETHHVSAGHLNVLCEQVCHHPPVTALYATNTVKKVEMLWWHQPVPRFYGGSVEATIVGQRVVKLTEHKETYELTSPHLLIRIFPVASSEWVGTTTVHCKESGLEATVNFKPRTFFGMRGSANKVSGKIFKSSNNKLLYELSGCWDGIVTLKDKVRGTSTILYDAQAAIADIHAPVVENLEGLSPKESVVIWSDLTESVMNKQWDNARDAKRNVEEAERNVRKARLVERSIWSPKYFVAAGDGNWVWKEEGQPVPHAPLVVK